MCLAQIKGIDKALKIVKKERGRMTDIERAIEVLKYYKPKGNESIYERGANHKDRESFNLAISALEKQTPRKPNKVFNGIESLAVCECGAEIYMFPRTFKGCPYCLQTIDWSVEDE